MSTRSFVGIWIVQKPFFRFRVLALSVALLGIGQGLLAQPYFYDVTSRVGLASYRATTGDGHGPGGVFADLDNDTYPDLYLVHNGANVLYVNRPNPRGGRLFEILSESGAEDRGPATGAIAGDYDNDGDLDLFVTNFYFRGGRLGGNVLLQNRLVPDGKLRFIDVTDAAGLGKVPNDGERLDNSLTAAWGDLNRDGHLDLYVGNHDGWAYCDCADEGSIGQRDIFYLSRGNGTFVDATLQYGLTGYVGPNGGPTGPIGNGTTQRYSSTNAVVFADFNNDRWPDLLVTNKVGGNSDVDMLYLNRGADRSGRWLGVNATSRTLAALPTLEGGASLRFGTQTPGAMGVAVDDIDFDGDLDVYMTDTSAACVDAPGGNDLWINNLDGSKPGFVYSNAAGAKFSWGTQIEDFSNNGAFEIHVATALQSFEQPDGSQGVFGYRDAFYASVPPPGCQGVAEVGLCMGFGSAKAFDSRGDLAADYDQDGDLDLFVVNLDGPSTLWENRLADAARSHFLALELIGAPAREGCLASTRDAIGARAILTADVDGTGPKRFIREVLSGDSNAASTSSLELEFGLGRATRARLEVHWLSGRTTTHDIPRVDRRLVIKEPESAATLECQPSLEPPRP